ncbi:hypothetical protein [Planktothrix pseudagardhii]|uniref:Uncharacterized protein n=1 Tax=Planktothrix pseudagardhii TaxID=132604 RepID=A0A9W4G779_9CYAN|nr:hypothetical protein [Planktothrix pseudagardhii]CAD5950499.1 hypothetical protein NO713_02527 [Planktothrix pseudagardhii]
MMISDLSYFEKISENELILGGALLTVNASALVENGSTLAITDVEVTNKGKVTKATGTGTALAVGTNPLADVDVYYLGFDKVKVKVRSGVGENYAFETLKIKAIDLPN